MSDIKQMGHYKEKVAELERELVYKDDRLRWQMTEIRALNSKLNTIRWSTSYTKLQELEGMKKSLQDRYEKQSKILAGFCIYCVLATIALIALTMYINK